MGRMVMPKSAKPSLPTKPATLILHVLSRASDGHVYAKFVCSPYEYIEWSIWVPKTLVTNIKGPITQWVPKTKH